MALKLRIRVNIDYPVYSHIVLPDVILCALIAFRAQTSTTLRLSCFAVYTYLTFHALIYRIGITFVDYALAFYLATQWLNAVAMLWLLRPWEPEEVSQDKDQSPVDGLTEENTGLRYIYKRMWWAFVVNHNKRVTGHSAQMPNFLPAPALSRPRFVTSRLIRAAIFYSFTDMLQMYMHTNLVFSPYEPQLTAWSHGCLAAVSYGWIYASWLYSLTVFSDSLNNAIMVGLGMEETNYIPDIFGDLRDAWTVRRFWGKVWHQKLRRIFSTYGRCAVHFLGIPRGTYMSSITQLYVAFALSGLLHTAGDFAIDKVSIYGSLSFFLTQAVAITVEEYIILLASRFGLALSPIMRRLMGYAWVFSWFSFCLSWHIGWYIDSGMGWGIEIPSILGYILGKPQMESIERMNIVW